MGDCGGSKANAINPFLLKTLEYVVAWRDIPLFAVTYINDIVEFTGRASHSVSLWEVSTACKPLSRNLIIVIDSYLTVFEAES